jgi:hypothetical protein
MGRVPSHGKQSSSFQYTNTATGLGAGSSFGNGCPGTGCVGITTNLTNAAAGQCDPPIDINTDGTGTDLFYRNWVGAYAAHVNMGPCPGKRRKSPTRGFWGTAEMQLREHTPSIDVTAGGGGWSVRRIAFLHECNEQFLPAVVPNISGNYYSSCGNSYSTL